MYHNTDGVSLGGMFTGNANPMASSRQPHNLFDIHLQRSDSSDIGIHIDDTKTAGLFHLGLCLPVDM
jgi:hypothetical protein